MDMKMQAFLDKVKDMADKTGRVSRHAAGVAGKKANDLALATRINLQIFDLNTECEALYKEIGKLVYDLHRGAAFGNGLPALRQAVRQGRCVLLGVRQRVIILRGMTYKLPCRGSCAHFQMEKERAALAA